MRRFTLAAGSGTSCKVDRCGLFKSLGLVSLCPVWDRCRSWGARGCQPGSSNTGRCPRKDATGKEYTAAGKRSPGRISLMPTAPCLACCRGCTRLSSLRNPLPTRRSLPSLARSPVPFPLFSKDKKVLRLYCLRSPSTKLLQARRE